MFDFLEKIPVLGKCIKLIHWFKSREWQVIAFFFSLVVIAFCVRFALKIFLKTGKLFSPSRTPFLMKVIELVHYLAFAPLLYGIVGVSMNLYHDYLPAGSVELKEKTFLYRYFVANQESAESNETHEQLNFKRMHIEAEGGNVAIWDEKIKELIDRLELLKEGSLYHVAVKELEQIWRKYAPMSQEYTGLYDIRDVEEEVIEEEIVTQEVEVEIEVKKVDDEIIMIQEEDLSLSSKKSHSNPIHIHLNNVEKKGWLSAKNIMIVSLAAALAYVYWPKKAPEKSAEPSKPLPSPPPVKGEKEQPFVEIDVDALLPLMPTIATKQETDLADLHGEPIWVIQLAEEVAREKDLPLEEVLVADFFEERKRLKRAELISRKRLPGARRLYNPHFEFINAHDEVCSCMPPDGVANYGELLAGAKTQLFLRRKRQEALVSEFTNKVKKGRLQFYDVKPTAEVDLDEVDEFVHAMQDEMSFVMGLSSDLTKDIDELISSMEERKLVEIRCQEEEQLEALVSLTKDEFRATRKEQQQSAKTDFFTMMGAGGVFSPQAAQSAEGYEERVKSSEDLLSAQRQRTAVEDERKSALMRIREEGDRLPRVVIKEVESFLAPNKDSIIQDLLDKEVDDEDYEATCREFRKEIIGEALRRSREEEGLTTPSLDSALSDLPDDDLARAERKVDEFREGDAFEGSGSTEESSNDSPASAISEIATAEQEEAIEALKRQGFFEGLRAWQARTSEVISSVSKRALGKEVVEAVEQGGKLAWKHRELAITAAMHMGLLDKLPPSLQEQLTDLGKGISVISSGMRTIGALREGRYEDALETGTAFALSAYDSAPLCSKAISSVKHGMDYFKKTEAEVAVIDRKKKEPKSSQAKQETTERRSQEEQTIKRVVATKKRKKTKRKVPVSKVAPKCPEGRWGNRCDESTPKLYRYSSIGLYGGSYTSEVYRCDWHAGEGARSNLDTIDSYTLIE